MNISNSGQEGGLIIVVNGTVDKEIRNIKMIQLQNYFYVMGSANLENYDGIYFHKDDWD